jgi:hypothetical protein
VKCKAERDIDVYYTANSRKKVRATAGHEADALRAEIDLVKYVFKGTGRNVVRIVGHPPCTGGKTPCGTCQGIKYAPPPTPPPKEAIRLFMVEVADCIKGQKPYEVVPAASTMYDPAAIADECLRYRNGKWEK